ncbi:MAG: hypothetical protein ACRDD8_14120 [Bacteroidales bacterium]
MKKKHQASIENANKKLMQLLSACDELAIQAKSYIDIDDIPYEISCFYIPSDGLCISISSDELIDDVIVFGCAEFFELAESMGKITSFTELNGIRI